MAKSENVVPQTMTPTQLLEFMYDTSSRTDHYLIVNYDFAPEWDEGFRAIAPEVRGKQLSERRKGLAILKCADEKALRARRCTQTEEREEAPATEDFQRFRTKADVKAYFDFRYEHISRKT